MDFLLAKFGTFDHRQPLNAHQVGGRNPVLHIGHELLLGVNVGVHLKLNKYKLYKFRIISKT